MHENTRVPPWGYILQEIKSVVLKMDSIKNYPEGETWKIGDKDMPECKWDEG